MDDHSAKWGPLAGLVGDWEGDQGLDISYHHAEGEPGETKYRETATFKPFGPVDNGDQHLYGLDYKAAMWREGEDDPFHTELGYWLWDGDLGHVMRAFVIPRGSAILAGGEAAADATTFTMKATAGDVAYGMATNPYLVERASCGRFEVTITVNGDTFSYSEDTILDMAEVEGDYHHTDANTLRRIATYDFPTE